MSTGKSKKQTETPRLREQGPQILGCQHAPRSTPDSLHAPIPFHTEHRTPESSHPEKNMLLFSFGTMNVFLS
jgi:hypothetical protein